MSEEWEPLDASAILENLMSSEEREAFARRCLEVADELLRQQDEDGS